ncbi:MAG: FecR domain-containing protein [Myxococcota bacterium]
MLAILLFVPLACTGSEAPPPLASAAVAPEPKATLRAISGEVTVKRATSDGWMTAAGEVQLFENDKVRTAAGATAVLDFPNGSTVNLGEDALVSITETRPRPGQERSDLTVLKGTIDAELDDQAKESITVTTPSATVRAGREIVFQ